MRIRYQPPELKHNPQFTTFLYVLRCSDGTQYVGLTTQPEWRMKKHARGKGAMYTRKRLPITLEYLIGITSTNSRFQEEALRTHVNAGKPLGRPNPDIVARLNRNITRIYHRSLQHPT